MTPKAQVTKENVDKLNFIRKFLQCLKRHYQQNKKETQRIGKTLAYHLPGKELISILY